jgi:PAS domain S-box-containing protein
VVLLFNDITEKKKLQDKIKENELLLRSIIQAEPECVKLIARNGELLEMNKAGLAMIEADDLQQVKGASVYEFVCEPYREEFTRLTGNVFNGTSGMLEFEITGLKGTRRWMETHAVPLKNAEGKIISLLGVSRDITERKQAEEKLRIADQRLASHLNNSPIGVIEWDKDFVIREWSAQAEKIFGWKQEEVLGKHFRDFKMVFEEDAAAVEKLSLDLIEKRTEQYTSINRNYTKDGRVIYCEWFNSVLKDEHGNIQSILSLILDITGQKKNEERLIQLSQAVEQSPASVVITDTRGDIEYVNKKFTDITGYLPQEVIGANPRILKSGYTSTEEYEKLWNVITSGREWYGEFYNRKKDGELYWEAAHISPIMNSENEITGFLAVKEDITEKKKAEEELLNSKKRFQNLVENISGVYWVNDLETYQTLYISPSYEKIWGRKCDDLYKDPADFMQAIHPDDLSIVTTAFEQQSINGKTEIIYRIIRPDGSLRWIFAKTNVVVDSNGRKMEYGYAEDITEIKLAEQSLRESEETFRRLFNESADPVLLLDERGFVDFNRAAISMLGYTSGKEFLYKKPWDISPTQQPDGKLSEKKAQEMIDKALQLGYNRFEWIYIKSDGTEFPVEVMLTPIMLKGRQSFYTVWRDIADRKKAEKKIEEILKRYEILAQATSDTIWDWDIAHNKMVYNYGITSMFGYDIAQVESIPDWWQNNIHPDDIKMVTDRVEEIFKKQETVFQMEFRYRCADGSYKNILDRAIVMYDEKKNPIRMVGAMQDITFQKEKELLINKAIIDAQERERQQMGMELHDNVNQILSASLLYLGMAKNEKKNKNEIFETINQTSGFIKDAITETRRLSHQLAPVSFKDVSLREVVESLAKNMNSQNQWRVSVQFDENHNATVRDDIKINLYRIIQEQLNNISKYARASEVAIIVTTLENKIQLKVIDNGIGFDPKTVKRGIGLENIKRRTEVFSGLLTIISSPGNGCQVVVELPLKNV